MATNITITKQADSGATHGASTAAAATARKLPGWLWFIALWCFGVGSAMSLGFAFKILMNATLFAVK
ncbi:hypothetical protein B0G80_5775 [Paraburkholderia sp. BL6669N2]|uniref:hypothetical protein n=1 Tax=unclassified Paraburkholderia TaxID=2615204 RepID=UPI000E261049|nr:MULTISPECIES: hypothetical protein [unclassified Paraburkholderia]REG49406.1 hypothetical protein B0G80_5775 [Paraburkholderia sp. BL6669N2]TDY22372.1 hypothetical protein B0G81_2671 [Paraburkholderia sp. BL6665CI2N2]